MTTATLLHADTGVELASFVDRALARANKEYAIVLLPAPAGASLDAMLARSGEAGALEEMSFLLEPPEGEGDAMAGFGAAARVDVAGAARFEALQARSRAVFEASAIAVHPELAGVPRPRMAGGLAFEEDPGAAKNGAHWDGFGGGSFTLPRWMLVKSGARAHLQLAVVRDEARSPAGRARVLEELAELMARLVRPRAQAELPEIASIVTEPPLAAYADALGSIARAIESGEVEKIVASRRTFIVAREPWPALAVLARLAREKTRGVRFAFHRGGATFLGLTPEHLISKHGSEIRGEALAGTVPLAALAATNGDARAEGSNGAAPPAPFASYASESSSGVDAHGSVFGDARAPFASSASESSSGVDAHGSVFADVRALLASAKDGAEHACVVHFIADRLRALADDVDHAPQPEARMLGHLAHLATPISARARAGTHLLQLAAALHPTPAVAGLPLARAVDWIARREVNARGWYAGPIGWFDADGDGELFVALRSALLRDRSALLFAGGGIVAGSDAVSEYKEARLKERTLRAALGAEP